MTAIRSENGVSFMKRTTPLVRRTQAAAKLQKSQSLAKGGGKSSGSSAKSSKRH